ncbi:hypothetical protein BC831DRAFT_260164 [Entophlyctis helioformis]|nr:hypothetical protein BC831DRAFT_260164 [Entophlyctis helioformis]
MPSDSCQQTCRRHPPPQQQSLTIGNKRKRADADAPVKERAVLFTIHLNNQAHLVQANFGKQDEEAALQAVNVHLGMWADFGQCVSSNNAETIRNGRKGLVSWEYAARIERRMDNATVYNEAHLVSSYQQIVQDLVDTTDAANTARVNVIPETSVTSGCVDLMVYRDQQRHVAIEMKVPNGIGSDMRQEPQDLLQLMIDQHAKDTKSKQSVSSRAAGCLNQLINYLAKTTTEFGILSSYEHSWFVKRSAPIDGQESFFVSMSVPCTAEGPVTLRRALFYIINEVKIRAAGHSSPPPALWPTLEPTATPFDRDGWAVYRECAIHVCKSDARRCPCSGDKTLVTHDSGINLVQSTKPVLRLHDAIAQGRTGAGFIGCLDGQRVAIKGVSYTLCDDTNYDVIRREVAFYKEHEDLQGDAIPQVVEAVLSGDCAFLVMELGQRYRQWADADHALAEQALDKLHAPTSCTATCTLAMLSLSGRATSARHASLTWRVRGCTVGRTLTSWLPRKRREWCGLAHQQSMIAGMTNECGSL